MFSKILSSAISSLLVAGISWLVYQSVETKADIKLIKYQLDQNNKIFQDLYELKKNK